MKKHGLLMICISIQLFGGVPESIEGDARQELEESFKYKNAEDIFNDIYRTNFWHGWDSISGQGSSLRTTQYIRSALPNLIKKLGIKTMLDAPCGDFNWMSCVIDMLELDLYIGLDIVKSVIKGCQHKYGTSKCIFMFADLITCPLPKVDLIFSRDCLAHLSYADAYLVLKNFKDSGSTYLLTSHHVNTRENSNITNGLHYPIKLTLAPFNFVEPLLILEEKNVESASAYQGKCLALWRLKDIDLS